MHHDLELAYLGLEVPDPTTLTPFFGEVVGLIPGEPSSDGALTWRNDDKAHRVLVQEGPAGDAVLVGFEATDAGSFDRVVEQLRATGIDAREAGDDDRRARRVERLVTAPAPWGATIEVALGLERAATPFTSPLVPGGFHTDGVGFGHAVFATTAFEESHDLLVQGLRMSQSDWLEMEIAAGIELAVRFYHCNERHHSIAIARAPFDLPQRLHHLMLETNERDDVGAAFDRVWSTDLTIANGLGRHDNDGMFSFYVVTPAGFQVEIGHGARVVTDDWDDNRRYDRISAWGHQPVQRG